MTTITSAQMLREGWTRSRSDMGCPRLISPDGTEYTRCLFGKPALALIGDSGMTHYLRPVSLRRGESLLHLVRDVG